MIRMTKAQIEERCAALESDNHELEIKLANARRDLRNAMADFHRQVDRRNEALNQSREALERARRAEDRLDTLIDVLQVLGLRSDPRTSLRGPDDHV